GTSTVTLRDALPSGAGSLGGAIGWEPWLSSTVGAVGTSLAGAAACASAAPGSTASLALGWAGAGSAREGAAGAEGTAWAATGMAERTSTRLNSSHVK